MGVAMYDFDPAAAGWPADSQHKPLPLTRDQEVILIQDTGQGWALGHCSGPPERQGFYPTNYVMPFSKYTQMMMQTCEATLALSGGVLGADTNQAFNLARQSLGLPATTATQSPTLQASSNPHNPQTLSLDQGLGMGRP